MNTSTSLSRIIVHCIGYCLIPISTWTRVALAAGCLASVFIAPAYGARFGAYNARAMAMGGTGVASAHSDAAHYFNPALLATYTQYKERALQSRMVIPSATLIVSDSVWQLSKINHTNYEIALGQSIDNYNLDSTPTNAGHVGAVTRDLQNMLDSVAYDVLMLDGSVGLAFGVPSRWQGGAFFLQSRVIGGGVITPSDSDMQLLRDYIDSMDYIATDGARGRLVPALFDDQNKLIDLTGTLSSTAAARGLFLTESGVAIADSITLGQHTWRWGVTPKIQAVSSFDYVEIAAQGGLNVTQDSHYRVQPNADVGVAIELPRQQRIGLVIKNIFPFKFSTPMSRDLKIDPQVRIGWAQQGNRVTLAADLDLLPNATIAEPHKAQDFAIGAEWQPSSWLRPRVGYNHNLQDSATLGLVSVGLGLAWTKIGFDITLGRGKDKRQAAAQISVPF